MLPGGDAERPPTNVLDELRDLRRRVKDCEGKHQHDITTQSDRVSRLAADTEISLKSLQDQMLQTTRWMATINSLASNVTNVEQAVAELLERIGANEAQMLALLTDSSSKDDDVLTELHIRIDEHAAQLQDLFDRTGEACKLRVEREEVEDIVRQAADQATHMSRLERRLEELLVSF